MIAKLQPLDPQRTMLDAKHQMLNAPRTTHDAQHPMDNEVIAKKIETLFLNEFLKIMFEQTSFGQDKTVSAYLPFITSQIAESLAENGRGIGIGEFLSGGRRTELESRLLMSPYSSVSPNSHSPFPHPNFIMPVDGRISSGFGLRRDPINGELRPHGGIDIAAAEGSPIRAAASGTVAFSGFSRGYGNTVIIEHKNGLSTLYAHNSSNLVKVGDVVDTNTIIALVGSTGRSTGPHLHFEVRKGGTPVNPMGMIVRSDEYASDSS